MPIYDVIIIGAGSSGLMAAEVAARNHKQVLLVEKMEQAGRKLRITGKGRCNITNIAPLNEFLQHVGSDSRFLRNAFSVFFAEELIAYLHELGLEVKTERGNRIFPQSDKAQDVFFAFIKKLERSKNVTILKKTAVNEILIKEGTVAGVKTNTGKTYFSKKIILATGGLSYPSTGSTGDGYTLAKNLGHTIVDPYPALVPLVGEGSIPESAVNFTLKNVSVTAFSGTKKMAELFGEMRFTEDGIDGPIALTLSRLFAKGLGNGDVFNINIDFKPALESGFLDKKIISELNENGGVIFSEILRKWIPEALVSLALQFTSIPWNKKSHQITSAERKKILEFLKAYPIQIKESRGFSEAIITQGGILLKEINPKTMESKIVKNLYFAGEIMDLDADTGGYNLQIAFTTAYIAATNV